MIFTKALVLKVLGGLAVCTGVTVGGVKLLGGSGKGQENPNSQTNTEETPEELLKKAGLSCNNNNECSILTDPAETKLNVKQGETTFEVSSIPENSGKIKLQKNVTEGSYNKGLKLVIEDGDITKDDTNKLEQFETYEIQKGGEGEVTIPDNGTVTLTIAKVENSDSIFNSGGYKFSFNPTQDITIPTSISIKKGTNTEFKIKKEGMVLSLERAWDVAKLGEKVKITCTTTNNTTKECTLGEKISATIDNTSKEYSVESESQSKKIKFEENVAEYNQGFKFTVESEISLGDSKKLCPGNYEIKEQSSKWYLSKKSN